MTASQLLNYAIISFTYIRFYNVSSLLTQVVYLPDTLYSSSRRSKRREYRATRCLIKVSGSHSVGMSGYRKFRVRCIGRGTHECMCLHRYYAFTATFVMAFVGGYTVFLPGLWGTPSFIFSYAMIGILPVLYVYWKIRYRTSVRVISSVYVNSEILIFLQWQKLETMTFFEKERQMVDQYEAEINS